MDVSARGKRGIRSPGRGTSLVSNRKSTMARNMYTSLLARNRPGQWVFAPPNGLQLVLRSRPFSLMKRRESNLSALDPKTAESICSCLYGIRSFRPGCRALPPIVTGAATSRIPTGLWELLKLVFYASGKSRGGVSVLIVHSQHLFVKGCQEWAALQEIRHVDSVALPSLLHLLLDLL